MCYGHQPPPVFSFSFLFFLQGREMKPDALRPGEKNPRKVLFSVNFVYFIGKVSLPPLCTSIAFTRTWNGPGKQSRAVWRQWGRDVSSGSPGLDRDKFRVLGEQLPFLQALEIPQSLGLHTVSGSFLQILWASVGSKEQAVLAHHPPPGSGPLSPSSNTLFLYGSCSCWVSLGAPIPSPTPLYPR